MLNVLSALYQSISPLWEMSVTAAYAAAVVIVLRLLLKKRAPKQILCLLWLVVFARLLIPAPPESPLSIVPGALPGQEQQIRLAQQDPRARKPNPTQSPMQDGAQDPSAGGAVTPAASNPAEPVLTAPEGVTPSLPQQPPDGSFPWQAAAAGVWLAGAAAMGGYALFSYVRLRRRLFDAIRAKDGAWEHPAVDSPFILGMLRPRIYLPAGLVGQPRQFILCHERAHLRRLDHIVKPACWIALALHWFNPLAWAAFILMSRDIESACDESVVRQLGSGVKADYSTTLLALATGRWSTSPCPLAFGEGDAKGRIQNVLGYRRPALWAIVVSAAAVVLAAVCLLTDPAAAGVPEADPAPDASTSQGPENSPGMTQAPVNLADTLLDPWMKEVLDGERTFSAAYPYDNGRAYRIQDLRSFFYGDDQLPDAVVEAGKLAAVDLDRDGVNELVIYPMDDSGYVENVIYNIGYLILRRQGDEVYGYAPGWRSCEYIKADGTFMWSSGAADCGIASMGFDGGGFVSNNITWCSSTGGPDELYYVDGMKADKEEFYAAYDAHAAKPDPIWYSYTDGVLSPWLPDNMELTAQTDPGTDPGEAKLWLQGGEIPWLEWNGSTTQIGSLITPAQSPAISCRDFDGDGENEVVLSYYFNGFLQLDLYEWEWNQPSLAATCDTQQLLLRFNQNNVAGYNKDTRGLTVTYSHTEGGPGSEDDSRRYVTGHCTLPEGFFDGFEHIRDGYLHVYANQFTRCYLDETDAFQFQFEFYPADETMQELAYVDTLLADAPDSWYADHYMLGRPVGRTSFTLRYDGTGWQVREADALVMDYGDS